MAFGIDRAELRAWKSNVKDGKIDFLTHYWLDSRFPGCYTVTKVGCSDINRLIEWGETYNLDPNWIDKHDTYPHFDLFGEYQKKILESENKWEQIERFNL
ncbi:hypothetical protein [Oceanobacillus bengalensis]|uniref:Uncharacterized protein n=1 Tax=Oceanobacillus bengalensis TaxID=1435466 RepID=A0A494YSQ2_9BACI|nr:hypothetical protein [Oceanobacillus bengalensis]RKQ13159.1 hypothetical protein D8M05_17270 [Oceanobacillus bengalensis]